MRPPPALRLCSLALALACREPNPAYVARAADVTDGGAVPDYADAAPAPDAQVPASSRDAARDVAPTDVAGGVPRSCTWSAFAKPVLVGAVSSPDGDWSPSPTGDLRQLFLGSYRPGGLGEEDIYVATRLDATAAFGAARNVAAVNSADQDRGPHVSSDGRELFFISDRTGSAGGTDVWSSTRADASATFPPPHPVAVINGPGNDSDVWLSSDGKRLYFVSDRSGANVLYVSTRTGSGAPFSPPSPVAGVELGVEHPTLTPDELELLYSAERPVGSGYEIWRARRPSLGAPFAPPTNVAELNTPDNDHDPSLSRDGTTVFYVRGYLFTVDSGDIWTSTRRCLP